LNAGFTSATASSFNTRPTGSLGITGALSTGSLVSVSNQLIDANGIPASNASGSVRYQWRLNGAAIAGATESTYRIAAADAGGRLSVSAVYTDLGGTQEFVASVPSSAIQPGTATPAQYTALPRVRMETSLGNLVVELESDRAPTTVNNFLKYVNANFYDGTEFHRIISTFMAQGGGFDFVNGNFAAKSPLFAPIVLERTSTTGLSNLTGTLAMARTSVANSATSEFFINLVDNDYRLDAAATSDGNGYAVFGRVVDGGPEVMVKLKEISVVDNGAGEVSKPTVPVTLTDVVSINPPANAAPSGSVVIAGLPVQGRTLVARSLITDADGTPASGQAGAISYYWKANGEMIPGAFSSSLPLTPSMVGKSITAVASYTDLLGVSGYVASTPVKVIDANDSPSGRITIIGTPTAGSTLTASSSLVDVDSIPAAGQPGALQWQWHVGGVPVAGVTGNSYVVGSADTGKPITVTATYTDLAGTVESVTSAPAGSFTTTPAPALPRAWLRTNYGDLLIELEATRAASTVNNFVQYVKSGFYNNTVFHRVIDGFMVQGGGYTLNSTGQYTYKTPTQAAITLQRTSETGLSNTFGTIAMARTSDPNSATSQFFINVADNLFLDANPSTGADGYAVFGRVIDGVATLDLLASVPVRANGGEVSSPTVVIGIVGSYYDPRPPAGDVFVTGRPMQGQTLTAQHTLSDPDGLSASGLLGWVWRVDGVPATGVTPSTTFFLNQTHVGREISVEAVYRDNAGNIGYVASSPTSEVGLPIDARLDLSAALAAAGVTGARAAAVTGSVYHWRSHVLLDDVQVTTQAASVNTGAGSAAPTAPVAHTSADGRWTVDSLDFDVLLRVSANRLAESGETARAIDASDVLAALKLANGRAPNATQGESPLPISPYQVLAADIDRDGRVTQDDALGILKIAVGTSDSPAPAWRFAGESETLWNPLTGSVYTRQSVPVADTAASARSGQDKLVNLVGVLTGDVDGSWRPGGVDAAPAGGYDQLPVDYFQSLGLAPEALAQFGIGMG
jgi:cyclophilin family peptidyl-prolyl cis-trans isomerase